MAILPVEDVMPGRAPDFIGLLARQLSARLFGVNQPPVFRGGRAPGRQDRVLIRPPKNATFCHPRI